MGDRPYRWIIGLPLMPTLVPVSLFLFFAWSGIMRPSKWCGLSANIGCLHAAAFRFLPRPSPFGVDLMNVVPLHPLPSIGHGGSSSSQYFLPLSGSCLLFHPRRLLSFSHAFEIIVIEYWERGQLGNFLFVFSSTSFSLHGHVSGPSVFLFFSLSSSSECNPSLCIFAHLASPLFVSPSASYPPSPFINPLIQCRHGEAVQPCINKIFDPFLFFLSGVLSSLFPRSF